MESRYTWKNQLLITLRNIAVLGAIILLLGYLLVISNQAAKKELEELFVEEKRTITRIDEPVAYGYEDGAKIWELRSQVAEQEKETESSELTRIYELILFKGGEENILIRGDSGDWDKPREELTLTGNVVVESADGTTILNTEKLTWKERSKTLYCPEYVDFWVEANHVTANSLYSDDDLATIDFVGNVNMFVVGLEGENFVTREGDFPIEEIEGEEPGDGMNVVAEYVHYDKGDKKSQCFPYISLRVRNRYNLDEVGRPLPPEPPRVANREVLLSDPEYLEALQRSIAQMDLSAEERAFLEGEIDTLPTFDGQGGIAGLLEDGLGGGPGEPPSGQVPDDQTQPLTPQAGEQTETATPPGGINLQDMGAMGPDLTPPADGAGRTPIDLPSIPASDPTEILSSPDYSYLTGWNISSDLYDELYEEDPEFDPQNEKRPGLIFCYRGNKKFWCEELHIDLGEHRIEGLRRVDARFRDLRDEDREPPESRAARAVQESPTQMIGNFLVHNWREDVTEGYGRVLAIQPEKDIEADNVVYYEKADVVHAWGDVIVHQFSGEWWETSGAIGEIEEERAREDVRDPTVVTADAILSYSRRVTYAFGNVVFRQEKQIVTGNRGRYEEETEILVMAGDVKYTNEDGEHLSCALLTMDLYVDEYIAEGAAIARSIVPEEYRENLAELRGDEEVKPGDDARTRLLENRTAAGLGDWSMAIENPPPAPPIELMPGAEEEPEVPPELGSEVPPDTEGPESGDESDDGDDFSPSVVEEEDQMILNIGDRAGE